MKRFTTLLLCLALLSCTGRNHRDGQKTGQPQEGIQPAGPFCPASGLGPAIDSVPYNNEGRGIYWWKKEFSPNGYEKEFLKRHNIKRLYVNFFDVSVEKSWGRDAEEVVPIATTRFKESVPEGMSIIPVVYITIDVMRKYDRTGAKESKDLVVNELAQNICDRVLAMASFNSLGRIREIQFDCDWTRGTKDIYYSLCRQAGRILSEKGIILSGTIRLHQLEDISYPFDRGVLMVYNTGSLMNISTENSILDLDDVCAYIKNGKTATEFINARKSDGFRIDMAYPDFSWASSFRDGRFLSLLRISSCEDQSLYESIGQNRYRVIRKATIDGKDLQPGDIIRLDHSSMENILKALGQVEKVYGGLRHDNIIYHLDSLNLSKFSADEIESIYSCR